MRHTIHVRSLIPFHFFVLVFVCLCIFLVYDWEKNLTISEGLSNWTQNKVRFAWRGWEDQYLEIPVDICQWRAAIGLFHPAVPGIKKTCNQENFSNAYLILNFYLFFMALFWYTSQFCPFLCLCMVFPGICLSKPQSFSKLLLNYTS